MKKVFKTLFFIALIAAVVWTFSYLFKKSKPQEKKYETVEATIGTIQKKTVITGQINPRDEVSIKPQVSGIISKIYKEAGQMVKKDEVIAVVKIIPDVSSLASMESQVKLAKLNLDNVEKTFNRQKTLKDKGLIATEEFEKSQLEYAQAQENYSNALDQLNIVKEGISKNASEYTNTSIKSTIDGMILDIPVKVGNSVINSNTFNDGTTIATVADMHDMIFVGKMDETEVTYQREHAYGNHYRRHERQEIRRDFGIYSAERYFRKRSGVLPDEGSAYHPGRCHLARRLQCQR